MLLQLIDKGYYDYDYEKVSKEPEIVDWADTVKSDEEVQDMVSLFGFGRKQKKPETTEEIQEYLIKQESYNGGRNSSNS